MPFIQQAAYQPIQNDPFGVYIHIPFCSKRCDYCAFATWTDKDSLIDSYVDACRSEIREADLPPATTVFFGGGTPSLIDPGLLASILSAIDIAPGAEVTVECNPDSLSAEKLDAYLGAGVNRISLGVQSMVPGVLKELGREHHPAAVNAAVGLVRESGVPSFNIDLIYGAVGESLDDWKQSVDTVLAFEPPHISAYGLTVEPGTPLGADPGRHPDDDDQADKYLMAESILSRNGMVNYEISNWAKPGHESKHNLLYWNQGNYRGIGCSAHSHLDGHRWWNQRMPEKYIAAVQSGTPPLAGEEFLDEPTRREEGLQLSLRTSKGVPANEIDLSDPEFEDTVTSAGSNVVLTTKGRLLANEIALRIRSSPN